MEAPTRKETLTPPGAFGRKRSSREQKKLRMLLKAVEDDRYDFCPAIQHSSPYDTDFDSLIFCLEFVLHFVLMT